MYMIIMIFNIKLDICIKFVSIKDYKNEECSSLFMHSKNLSTDER